MGNEYLTRWYRHRGELKERFYVPLHPNQRFQEGDIIQFDHGISASHHRVAGLTAKVLARYYTVNNGFQNYGMCVQIIKGDLRHPKGKIMYLPGAVGGVRVKG